MSDVVRVEKVDEVLIISLCRQQALNAISPAVAEGIAAGLDLLDSDDGLRAGVLTGQGGVFSVGMDLKAALRGEASVTPERGFAGIVERGPTKPLIAAVEGHAIGGGLEVVLACDMLVASTHATFALPEVKRGRVAAGGGLFRLPQRIPRNVAMEMILTGEPIDAARAYELGLVNRVTEAGGALMGAIALARQVAQNAPLAVRTSKEIVLAHAGRGTQDGFAGQKDAVDRVRRSDDSREGLQAFVEKREPLWSGT